MSLCSRQHARSVIFLELASFKPHPGPLSLAVGGQRSCCSQWGLPAPQILPPAEANPDPLGGLAGLPVDYSCRNPRQTHRRTRRTREGTAKEGKFLLHAGGRRRRAAPKGCSCLSSTTLPTKGVWPRWLFAAGAQGHEPTVQISSLQL